VCCKHIAGLTPMLDTASVRSSAIKLVLCWSLAALSAANHAAIPPGPTISADPWPAAVVRAARLNPDARIVVLDVATGRLLAAAHLAESARTLAAPGSTLKPLLLYTLIVTHRWDPDRRIACSRHLHIEGRSLDCSHPPLPGPLNATEALTWSCNTYFAALAASIPPAELRPMLAPTGVLGQTGLAPNEATALFRDPATRTAVQLTALGVDGIRVTPLELAAAYRWLALQIADHPNSQAAQSSAAQAVLTGLADSASFGIAGQASLGGVPVAGKTGTANLGPGTPSHGWFVGFAPAARSTESSPTRHARDPRPETPDPRPTVVLCIYLPSGHGSDAARVAADILAQSPLAPSRQAHSALEQARP
jgi:cell division protein FtsI/penicillin-binding protein 2